MATEDDKAYRHFICSCKHFYMLELKQIFVKAIEQQAPAIQQFEETICQFSKHSAPKKSQSKLRIVAQDVHLLL